MALTRLSRRAAEALTLLLIFVSAYGAKVLHTHPDSYYAAIDACSDDSGSSIEDDCPICRFAFFPCLIARADVCSVFFVLCTFVSAVSSVSADRTVLRHFALRAPPSPACGAPAALLPLSL